MSGGRFVPSAASFNTERDLKTKKPPLDNRRSSYADASSNNIIEEGSDQQEVLGEEEEKKNSVDEPMTPQPGLTAQPGLRRPQMAGILDSRAPVILTSKPVFSNLYKKRAEGENGESS